MGATAQWGMMPRHSAGLGMLPAMWDFTSLHRVFLCPGTFLALQTGEGQMMGPAKARTPLLGPSGPACTMEMSYHIHSDPRGNLLLTPRVPCLLPAPRSPMPTCLCCLSQPCFSLSHHPGTGVSVSLHPMTMGWCHGGLPQGGQGFWVPTVSAPPLVPGFLAINVADHTTDTTQLAWQTQGRGSTTRGHVRVPLGERSRPFQVCWMHRDQPGGAFSGTVPVLTDTGLTAAAPRWSCWHWWISRARRVLVLTT